MGDVINLRLKRKEKEREAKAQTAAQNRVAYGRTKLEKSKIKAENELEKRNLDGHKLTPEDSV